MNYQFLERNALTLGLVCSPLPSHWLSAPRLSRLECPNKGPITLPAQPSLNLIIKHFLHLTQKIAEALWGQQEHSSQWRKCPEQGWELGESLHVTTVFLPFLFLEASPVCGWGNPAQSSLKTFELKLDLPLWLLLVKRVGWSNSPHPQPTLIRSSTQTLQNVLSSQRKIYHPCKPPN